MIFKTKRVKQPVTLRSNYFLWLPVGIWMGVIFYLSSQPSLPDVMGLSKIDWGDKVEHAVAFAFGGALIWRALARRFDGWHRVIATMVWIAVFGASDELHQWFVPPRTPDMLDLLFDVIGAGFAAVVLTLITGGYKNVERTK